MIDSYTPVHTASLIDPSLHSPAMLQLLETEMSRSLIEYVVECIVDTVHYAMGRPSSSRGRSHTRLNEHVKFTQFVTDVLRKAEVKVPVILVMLVYIDRAKPHLQIALEQWAYERVFLGALILANKYTNDSTLKNVHWALCTGVFGKRDIGRIEREFLDVLDFELGFNEDDILSHHAPIMSLSNPNHHTRTPATAVLSPLRSSSPESHWSSDSSDMESISTDESSSPRTPEMVMEVDAASFVPTSSKEELSPADHAHLASAPSKSKAESASVHSHTSHQRLSSALQILRSFPMLPHFHHTSTTSSASSSATSSSSSLGSTSSSSSSFSIPFRGCKPAHFAAPALRTTSVSV
ncbi:unnamed protein product [Somion occarium]|uniref:Cyclin N-terminal domain-containing protein n=1 Tax=Somion occarium TaxID=3059160 RepID=A0ABP1DGL4_9APHY